MKTYKEIIIDNNSITIYRQYEKKYKQYRYSYGIQTSTGYMGNGGYGINNEISHPTYESILTSALQVLNLPKEQTREYKLTLLLNNTHKNETI